MTRGSTAIERLHNITFNELIRKSVTVLLYSCAKRCCLTFCYVLLLCFSWVVHLTDLWKAAAWAIAASDLRPRDESAAPAVCRADCAKQVSPIIDVSVLPTTNATMVLIYDPMLTLKHWFKGRTSSTADPNNPVYYINGLALLSRETDM